MQYHLLATSKKKSAKRAGRGIAAGRGKTAGRGTKGQNSRSGGGVRIGFEGGQNPLAQRLPKLPGFRSIRPKAENVHTQELETLKSPIDNHTLFAAGLTSSAYVNVKLIAKGTLTKKHSIKLQSASKQAIAEVKKAGGSVELVEKLKRPAKEKSTKDKAIK